MITTIEIICSICGKKHEKRLSEINRRKKKGKDKFYCSRSCSSKDNCSHLSKYRTENYKFIKSFTDNRRDEYTLFRYHLRNAKQRSKGTTKSPQKLDCDITLEILKDLWDKQKGLCSVTRLVLISKAFDDNKIKSPYQASLDRIDNSKGYVKDNIRFVCLMFNYARNNFTDEETLEFFKKVSIQ